MSVTSCYHLFRRKLSSNAKKSISSKIVRSRFIEFFEEHDHNFIRSSSVVPFHDRAIPFINAGMCQFKRFLSGEVEAPFKRVVNSQKCIRVSGKHNDLNEVGFDGHHHTFFEMLGNWSFNDYFKETACKLAWELLTTPPFSLDKNRLYVTYFGGAPSLSLPPDLETHDIWRKIGIPEHRIFPAGLADNFWEMSRIGPCGPSTEILIDRSAQAQEIQSPSQLIELWNIVFIQYNRDENGSLNHLPTSHIDTGMGLERVLAVLLKKSSNYDTDLFAPLFETINQVAGVKMYEGKFGSDDVDGIDTAYRKLADHCRMVTVAMADGVFPDTNTKLRRILRKTLTIPEKSFKLESGTELVIQLSQQVAESLVTAYPEIQTNINQVQTLIQHEAELLKSLQKSSNVKWNRLLAIHPELNSVDINSMLGITNAYTDTINQMKKRNIAKGEYLPSDLVLRLFDTYGLDLEAAQDLGNILGFKIDSNEFNEELNELKDRSKEDTLACLKTSKLFPDDILEKLQNFYPKTDDSYKYNYHKNEQDISYVFNHLNAKLLAVIKNDKIIFSTNQTNENYSENHRRNSSSWLNPEHSNLNLNNGEELFFIFDKTCFYSEAGGQEWDRGYFIMESFDKQKAKITVNCVKNFHGYITHCGKVEFEEKRDNEFIVESSCDVTLVLDESHRLGNMQNHTAVHILHALLCQSNSIVAQRGSDVNSNSFTLDFSLIGSKLDKGDLDSIEGKFKQIVQSSLPVKRRVICGDQILSESVKLLPGEVYPFENISVIEIKNSNFLSKEACCGTHVLNTRDIDDFVITKFKLHNRIYSITGVTGKQADIARLNADRVINKIKICEKDINKIPSLTSSALAQVNGFHELLKDFESELRNTLFPVNVTIQLQEFIELKLKKKLKLLKRSLLFEEVVEEIKDLVKQEKDRKFIVHFLTKHIPNDKIILMEVFDKISINKPILVFGYIDGSIKAGCIVPKAFISKDFNAQKWMDAASKILDRHGFAKKTENADEKFHLEKKMRVADMKSIAGLLVEKSISKAEEAINR